MAVSDEISRIKGNIASAYSSAGAKGATLPAVQNSANLAGCIDTITGGGGEPVNKVKFGASIDTFIGDVDANGKLQSPKKETVLDLTGVTKLPINTLAYKGYGAASGVIGIIANDVVEVASMSVYSIFCTNRFVEVFEFNGLESIGDGIDSDSVFYNANYAGNPKLVPHFNKLRNVKAPAAFLEAFSDAKIEPDETFPVLEYISGTNTFNTFRNVEAGDIITFSAIKTIVGSTSQYSSTFGSYYVKNTVWNFPSATSFTGYIWDVSTSYPGEIHFAAANQAAIEACDGYDKKWGFAGATIFFDL